MIVVGLLGGIGSGKSTVAGMFHELGAECLDADRIAHEVLESDPVRQELVRWLGPSALGPDGRVDRRAVAAHAFRDAESLRKLEGWIHPPVVRRVEERVEELRRSAPRSLVILDVALLLDTRLRDQCDALVFVDAPMATRKERARLRGWDPEEIERRERFQADVEDKRRVSDFVIRNHGELAETRRQVEECHARILNEHSGRRRGQGSVQVEDAG